MAYQSDADSDPATLARALRLFRCYQQASPRRIERRAVDRIIPALLVHLGELRGLIYRSDRGQAGRPETYVHFFSRPPSLVTDAGGTRLFIVGGRYQVTRRGIEG